MEKLTDALQHEALETPQLTDRRTVLTRGLAALAGITGLKLMASAPVPDGALPKDAMRVFAGGGNLRLAARRLRLTGAAMPPKAGDRLSGVAELLDGSGSHKVGEFYSVCICVHAPFGVSDTSAAQVEHHVFVLRDGTVVGMGTVPPNSVNRTAAFAIIGGTGRFEGVRGSYEAKQNPIDYGGDGTAAFAFKILR